MVPQIARRHRMFPPARLLFSGGGMTVLEVIVALFFFTVGVLAVTGMQVIGMRSSVDAAIRGANCILAGDTIEKILSLPYTDPRLDDPDAGFHPDHPDYGPHPIQPRGVRWNGKWIFRRERPISKGSSSPFAEVVSTVPRWFNLTII
jgi:hypothetical protein